MRWLAVKPMDLLLWGAALAGLLALYACLWRPAAQAATLTVLLDNKPVKEVGLNQNQRFLVSGPLGDSELQIEGGKVRFLHSPCRNQVCVHHGWASHNGELLACLPNRIALVLSGDAESTHEAGHGEIDAINF
jgi:hypothetical protein